MRSAILVLAGATALAQTPVQLQKNLFLGEWTLNVEKTKMAGNARPPQNGRRTYEDRGDGVVVGRREGTGADGQPFLNYYAVRYDGRDYPYVVLGARSVGQIAFELPDPASTTWSIKQDGVVTATGTSQVSADGETLMVTTNRPPGGQSVEVYDRLRGAAGNSAALSTGPAQERKFGRWRLRVDPPAQGTREYDDRGGGMTLSIRKGVNARGQEYYSSYAAKVDGKEYPRVVKGSTSVNTIAFTRVDEDTVAYTLRENGKVTATGTTTVSKDGQVLTVTTTSVGAPASGRPEIYDRIP